MSLRANPHHPTFRIVDWTVDPASGEMCRGDQVARLEPRVMEVLLHLVAARGRVVSKDELFESVWGGVAVSDDVLRRCIYNLRCALGDDSGRPRYIRTLPRRGYQLIAEVSPAAAVQETPDTQSAAARPATIPAHRLGVIASGAPPWHRRPVTRVALVAVLLVVASAVLAFRSAAKGSAGTSRLSAAELRLANESPSPTTAEEYFDLGMNLAARRGGDDFERAIELFNRALELDPDHARAHAELANVYALSVRGYFRELSRFDLAIEHATLALGLDPDMVEANKALGIAFAGKGWLSAAAREYERALALRPDYQAVINNLAVIEVIRGNLVRALQLQRRLDNATPRRALHLNNLGHTYRLLGDTAAARRVLQASLEVMPDNSLAAANLAIVDLVDGDVAAARARVRRTLPLYPTDARFLATAGLVALAAGAHDEAQELFDRSAKLSADGTNNGAWLGLAYLQLRRGDVSGAETIFAGFYDFAEESRRLRREHWVPHYNLMAIHAMSGRVAAALDELEEAIAQGFIDIGIVDAYPFFSTLRDEPRYHVIASDLRRRIAKMRNEAYETDAQ